MGKYIKHIGGDKKCGLEIMQKSIKVSLFITSDKKLQVKVMASEAAMTFTSDIKADRKSAENTTFQHRSCACFRRSPHGVKIRLFMKIRGRKCRNVRKIGIFSGDVREKGVDLWQKKKWLYIFIRKKL